MSKEQTIDDGGLAFPQPMSFTSDGNVAFPGYYESGVCGMTLRQYYAGLALPLAFRNWYEDGNGNPSEDFLPEEMADPIARDACMLADALIAELKKGEPS